MRNAPISIIIAGLVAVAVSGCGPTADPPATNSPTSPTATPTGGALGPAASSQREGGRFPGLPRSDEHPTVGQDRSSRVLVQRRCAQYLARTGVDDAQVRLVAARHRPHVTVDGVEPTAIAVRRDGRRDAAGGEIDLVQHTVHIGAYP